jgi:hypothetical protein
MECIYSRAYTHSRKMIKVTVFGLCTLIQYVACDLHSIEDRNNKERNLLIDDVIWLTILIAMVIGLSYLCCFFSDTSQPTAQYNTCNANNNPPVIHVRIDHGDTKQQRKRSPSHTRGRLGDNIDEESGE